MTIGLLIIFPLIGSLMIELFNNKNIGIYTTIITSWVSLYLWSILDYNLEGYQLIEYGILGVDSIAINLIILTGILMVIIVIYGPNEKRYIIWLLVTESIIMGIFSVIDIINFYILFELILIPIYYIMKESKLLYPYRKNKINRAIFKLIGYTIFGSFIMLLGMILLYKEVGNMNYLYLLSISDSYDDPNSIIPKFIFISFFLAFSVKVPIMPFHIWLPEAHSEAPTGGSMILAGIILKLGTYGIIRYLIPLFPNTTLILKPYIMILLSISVVYSAITIIRQVELKKFIAYSSISHMNLCLIGLFSGKFDGILGSYLIMINHGIVSSGLFLCAGILFNRYTLRPIKYYRGLFISMPLFSIFFIILNLANIGFPPFGSFISEILVFIGSLHYSFSITLFSSLSILLAGIYGIWTITRIIFGKSNYSKLIITNDLTRKEFYLLSLLLSLSLLLGLFPSILTYPLFLPISFLSS